MARGINTCEFESITEGDACPECSSGELDLVHRHTKQGKLLILLECDCCPWKCIHDEEDDL